MRISHAILALLTLLSTTTAVMGANQYGHTNVYLKGTVINSDWSWGNNSTETSYALSNTGDDTFTGTVTLLSTESPSLYMSVDNIYNTWYFQADNLSTGTAITVSDNWHDNIIVASSHLGKTYDVTLVLTSATSGTIRFDDHVDGPDEPGPSGPTIPTGALSETLPDAIKAHAQNGGSYVPESDMTMWYGAGEAISVYEYPIIDDALLIGNGHLGAMISDDPTSYSRKIYLSDKSVFSGGQSGGEGYSFKKLGQISLTPNEIPSTNAIYQVDMEKGVYSNAAKYGNGKVEGWEMFASYPDQLIACQLSSSTARGVSYKVYASINDTGCTVTMSGDNMADAVYQGTVGSVDVAYQMRVIANNGTLRLEGSNIVVSGADNMLILISEANNYDSSESTALKSVSARELSSTVAARIARGTSDGWLALYERHVADHSALFNRMTLRIDGQTNDISTEQMVDLYSSTATSGQKRMAENLVFAFGRYMEIACSRGKDGDKGVDCPSNLMGIWTDDYAPWLGDIHGNINVNMNYWPSEATNLSETHLGLCNWVINLSKSAYWRGLTSGYSDPDGNSITQGWTCWMASNPFGGGYHFPSPYNTAQAWYCHHLIQHYLYTMDSSYRDRMLPVLWEACKFWSKYMRRVDEGGSYVYEVLSESSPESGIIGYGAPHAQQMVSYLFKYTVEIAKKHGLPSGATSAELSTFDDINTHIDRGLHTYMQDGKPCLREDKYTDGRYAEKEHRHLSHLTCVYPLGQVHPGDAYYEAAVNTMEDRGAVGYGVTDLAVWTTAWKAANWAQARDQRAFANYAHSISRASSSSSGLFKSLICCNKSDSQGATAQVDGNFGLTGAVAEMLLQSNRSEITAASPYAYIDIAPVLPDEWAAGGEVTGLKAQGNYEVSYSWSNGRVTKIEVKALAANPVAVYVHYDRLNSTDYHISQIGSMSGNDRVALSTDELSSIWRASSGSTNDQVWKFVPLGYGAKVTIELGEGTPDIEETAEYYPYTRVEGPGSADVHAKGGKELMHIMVGNTAVYHNGSGYSTGGVKWTITGSDDTMPADAAQLSGFAAASTATGATSAQPMTEVNGAPGTDISPADHALFLTPVAGDFVRVEPHAHGSVTVWLRYSTGTATVVDEDGVLIETTVSSSGDMHRLTFGVKAGKSYYVSVASQTPSFVAADMTAAAGYSAAPAHIYEDQYNNLSGLSAGSAYDITVHRTFSRGYWHPVVLPFAVSETQMRQVFGQDVAVLYIDPYEHSLSSGASDWLSASRQGVYEQSLYFTRHHYQMLYANVPAYICPSQSVSDPVFHDVTYQGNDVRSYAIDADGGYEVTGWYDCDYAEGNIYYLSNSGGASNEASIYHTLQGVNLKATRAWIQGVSGRSPAPLRTIGIRQADDDAQQHAAATDTGISTVISDEIGGYDPADDHVYNLMGIAVGKGSTDGLAAGVYIHKGRKIYVR